MPHNCWRETLGECYAGSADGLRVVSGGFAKGFVGDDVSGKLFAVSDEGSVKGRFLESVWKAFGKRLESRLKACQK